MARLFTIVFLLILIAVAISFTMLNADPVELNYYIGVQQIPLSLAIVFGIAVGALFGLFSCLGAIVKLKRRVSKLQKAVSHAEVMAEQNRAMSALQK